MERIGTATPEIGHLIPVFSLRAVGGGSVSPWDFKGRKNLLIAFFDPRSPTGLEMLAELKREHSRIQDENAQVLAIGHASEEELRDCVSGLALPYAVLADPTGQTHDLYAATGAALFVADRFGELILRLDASGNLDSALDAALTRLALIELQCPECGVPTWDQ